MAMLPDLHVLIVGAGTTGLLIAQGLKKYGIKFSIFEGDSQDNYLNHQRDWSMALLWGADYIKNTLPNSLRDRFDEIKTDKYYQPEVGHEETLPFYNGKTGELVVRLPGGLATRVSRVKLRKLFAEDLDIEFNKSVTDCKEEGDKVTLTFKDGSSVIGNTVVFCDGVKSSAGRGLLLGEENAQLAVCNCSIVNITHRYTAKQARFIRGSLNPVFKFASHPDDNTLFLLTTTDIPSLEKPEQWNFQCLFTVWGASIAETPAERLRIFKEQASQYAEPWKSAVQWLPDDIVIPRDRIKYWANPSPWPTWRGKVTLAGDAAHPMVPFRAQGLNNAMRDSFGYVEAIRSIASGASTLDAAISDYTTEVFGRGAKEIAISNAFGPLMHNWEALMNSPLMKLSYGKKQNAPESEPVKEPVQPAHVPQIVAPVPAPITVITEAPTEPIKATDRIDSPLEEASKSKEGFTTPELVSDSDSQAATVLASPEFKPTSTATATDPAAVSEKESKSTNESAKPSWEDLKEENQRLKKLNEELMRKLIDVSSILGTEFLVQKTEVEKADTAIILQSA